MTKEISEFCFAIVLVFSLTLASCNRNTVFTDSVPMKNEKWHLDNILSFDVPVEDTVSGNDISFIIRTGPSYPFRNLYLFITTSSPEGRKITDTIQYFLADEKGRWYGKGFGDIYELTLPFKTNVFFPAKGTFNFTIRHGMRDTELRGFYDFGLKVTRAVK